VATPIKVWSVSKPRVPHATSARFRLRDMVGIGAGILAGRDVPGINT